MTATSNGFFRYVPIRERDVRWGFYVTGAGHASISADSPYPPQDHPEPYVFTWQRGRTLAEYQILFITQGKGEFESAPTGRQPLEAGTLFVLHPGVWHRYRPSAATGWEEYWVSFAGDFAQRLVTESLATPEQALLKVESKSEILRVYQSLLDHLRGEATGFPQLLAADVIRLLATMAVCSAQESAELVSQGPRRVRTVEDRIVAEALQRIWKASLGTISVPEIVRPLPLTRRSLERRFQNALGHTIHEEITLCRLERAARLLQSTEMSISKVASAAGFTSADAMGRVFRQHKGVAPRVFRKQQQEGLGARG